MFDELRTPRLLLTDLAPDDAPTLFAYRNEPEVRRFQSWVPASVDSVRDFIHDIAGHSFNANKTWYQLAIRLAESCELVGDLGVHFVGTDGEQAEIGFTIAPLHQRHGYATEAVTNLVAFLFEVLRKHRVYASVDPRNEASIAVLRRVGLSQEAHLRRSLKWGDEWVDDAIFAALRDEWLAGRRAGSA